MDLEEYKIDETPLSSRNPKFVFGNFDKRSPKTSLESLKAEKVLNRTAKPSN